MVGLVLVVHGCEVFIFSCCCVEAHARRTRVVADRLSLSLSLSSSLRWWLRRSWTSTSARALALCARCSVTRRWGRSPLDGSAHRVPAFGLLLLFCGRTKDLTCPFPGRLSCFCSRQTDRLPLALVLQFTCSLSCVSLSCCHRSRWLFSLLKSAQRHLLFK